MPISKPTRHLITMLAAALVLTAAVSTASARNLSVSNQNIRVTWTSMEFEGGGVTVRCQLTLEGSFHIRTIAKVAGSLIGAVTKAALNQERCTSGSGGAFNGVERYNGTTSPNTLPWLVTYHSFTGTLPNIAGIRLAVRQFRIGVTIGGGICTGQYGTAEDSMVFVGDREGGSGVTSLTSLAGLNTITLFRRDGGLVCPNGLVKGTGSVMLLGTTTRISVTLI